HLGEGLNRLHTEKGGEQVGTVRDHAVVGHQKGVVMRDQRLERFAQLGRAWCDVERQREAAQRQQHFARQGHVERQPSGGVYGGDRRMRVAEGVDVGPTLVDEQVHGQLGGGIAVAGKFAALEVGDDQVVGCHHALAGGGGRSKDAARVQPNGDVAVGRSHKASLVNPAPDGANREAMLFLSLQMAGQDGISKHAQWVGCAPKTDICRSDLFLRRSPDFSRLLLGVNPAKFQREAHAVDGQHVGSNAVIDPMGFGIAHYFIEAVLHDVLQAFVDFAFAPKEALAILYPLEVADGDAASVAQNVGDNEYSLPLQNLVGRGGGGPVGTLAENARLNAMGVLAGDLVFDRGGEQDVNRLEEDLLGSELDAVSGALGDGLVLRVHRIDPGGDVETFFIVERAVDVGHAHD